MNEVEGSRPGVPSGLSFWLPCLVSWPWALPTLCVFLRCVSLGYHSGIWTVVPSPEAEHGSAAGRWVTHSGPATLPRAFESWEDLGQGPKLRVSPRLAGEQLLVRLAPPTTQCGERGASPRRKDP